MVDEKGWDEREFKETRWGRKTNESKVGFGMIQPSRVIR